MSDFQDFLDTLTPEQLRTLADIKENKSPNKKPKKRKQSRKKLILSDQVDEIPQSSGSTKTPGPKRKKQGRKKSTLDKMLDKHGAPARRLGPTPLGNRPNRFKDGDLSHYKNTEQEDIELDKLLNKNRKPSPRFQPERQPQFVDATCTKCDSEFENVSVNACYKDGSSFVFICDSCVKGLKN